MNDARLREALEAVLPWADAYEDHMSGEDFAKREAAVLFAQRVLAGDPTVTLEGTRDELERARRARAVSGPRLVIRSDL